ncbi:deoxyribose-phosphate aldolase [Parelusimicrobium proximum]|uniref:deoxyribose-phosphate aldolase n=1 Tax=Parelusimicrobium proximum TaxID=3228953 RepID=UPI003D16AF3D
MAKPDFTAKELAAFIDHTILAPQAKESEIVKLCGEAVKFGFASVCVNPCWVETARKELEGSGVKVCTVIGFPLGANTTEDKVFEAKNALALGAVELDMVINIGRLKSGQFEEVYHDIKLIRDSGADFTLKVIMETCLLTDEERVKVCTLAARAGADFVKTSTGFSTGGATAADVALLKKSIPERMKVKASGGIRDLQTMLDMIEAGAERIGTSSGVKILEGL